MSFNYVIADMKSGCILLSRTAPENTWVEQLYDREIFKINRFKDYNGVLYLYDATNNKEPLILPYCSVIFSSPNLVHFKEFINIDAVRRMVYYMPMWIWDEIEAFYSVSTTLQGIAKVRGYIELAKTNIRKLHRWCCFFSSCLLACGGFSFSSSPGNTSALLPT